MKNHKLALRDRITEMAAFLFRSGMPLWGREDSPAYEFRDLGYGCFEIDIEDYTFHITIRTINTRKE